MVSKTRDKFIEVARQLFARKGIENTTMNDIASASDKGRRTIYTYFKSKRDIFNAVIEHETDKLLDSLREIVRKPMSPSDKLYEYVACRFETIRTIVQRNGSLKAGFFRDVRKVDRARRFISTREVEMLCQILQQGVDLGEFDIEDIERRALVITHAVQGLDVPYIRDSLLEEGVDKATLVRYISDLILNGIKKRD
jgi:AcrR family transcriptional regulator